MKRELNNIETDCVERFNFDTSSLNAQVTGLCAALRERAVWLKAWTNSGRPAFGSHDAIATIGRAADLEEAALALEHYIRDAECALNAAKRQAHYLTQMYGTR